MADVKEVKGRPTRLAEQFARDHSDLLGENNGESLRGYVILALKPNGVTSYRWHSSSHHDLLALLGGLREFEDELLKDRSHTSRRS